MVFDTVLGGSIAATITLSKYNAFLYCWAVPSFYYTVHCFLYIMAVEVVFTIPPGYGTAIRLHCNLWGNNPCYYRWMPCELRYLRLKYCWSYTVAAILGPPTPS